MTAQPDDTRPPFRRLVDEETAPRFAPSVGSWPRRGHWTRRPRTRLDEALSVARQIVDRRDIEAIEILRSLATAAPAMAGTVAGASGGAVASASWPAGVPDPPPPPTQLREPPVIDLNPPAGGGPSPRPRGEPDYGLGREWGSSWRYTAQGWVDRESAEPRWRPVVSTTPELTDWAVDTYLGIVSGEAMVNTAGQPDELGESLSGGRSVAVGGMVDAAVARGAHAVIGTTISYATLGQRLLVTATGTAVTLRDR